MPSSNSQNNKRIAKNTLLLYFRMLLTMGVGLYTSRVVLQTLGVEDFGIYNVVGGVVTLFSIISSTLSAAITRFLTFELGSGNRKELNKIFSASISIQIVLSLLIVLLAECLGPWYIHNKMILPPDRVFAANCCFQFSLFSFCLGLISVPYNALIVAHEKMSAFAYIGIIDAFSKLFIAWVISFGSFDRLIFYGLLLAVLSTIIRIIYGWYCKKNFEESHFHFSFDKKLIKTMFGFAGWNFIGASAGIIRDQGATIILNLFFGPTVNAAQAIAVKINSVVAGFSGNFMTALNPQITKSYANGEHKYMFNLIFQGARVSFYMVLLVSLPIILNARHILSIWLGTVPNETTLFVQLVLIMALFEVISYPLVTAMLATGNIRNYQILVGGLQFLNIPISYVLLKMGCFPQTVTIVAIFIGQLCLFARLFMLKKMIGLNIKTYIVTVYLNVLLVGFCSIVIPVILLKIMEPNAIKFISVSFAACISTIFSCWFVGCSKQDRQFVLSKIKRKKI